jgi:glycosyltransferase involved in cell wall biosynthesis
MTDDDPIRLVQAMAGAPRGGAEAFYTRLVCALANYPAVTQWALTRAHAERERRFAAVGVPVERLRFGGRIDLPGRWRYRRLLRRIAPDVVLTYMNRASAATPRGDYRLIARLGHYYDLKYYRHCDYWVGNTRDICDHLVRGGMPAARVFHIANFIEETDDDPLSRDSFATPAETPVLLALGRLHINKAFDTLLRALPGIEHATLWLAGSGPEEQALRRLADELGLADRVRFLGWRSDVGALMRAADLFVCPSRHEGLGNIVLEAWFHGCPVVSTRSQGPRELIEDGENGLLTPIDDARALAEAINRMLREPDLAATLADNGRRRYHEGFSRDVICRQYLDLFQTVRR